MPLTLPRQRQQTRADEPATLVVLPLSMRSQRTEWLHRTCRLVCYAQRGDELVALVLQGKGLHLMQASGSVPISSPTSAELHQLMAAWPENGYAHLQVTLAGDVADRAAPQLGTCSMSEPVPAWRDGTIKTVSQATVVVKTKRKVAMHSSPPEASDRLAQTRTRPPQVFRLPAVGERQPLRDRQPCEAGEASAPAQGD